MGMLGPTEIEEQILRNQLIIMKALRAELSGIYPNGSKTELLSDINLEIINAYKMINIKEDT